MSGGKRCSGSLEFKSSDDEISWTADGAVRETLARCARLSREMNSGLNDAGKHVHRLSTVCVSNIKVKSRCTV